jgi:Zn-dependent M28 family amino/carboxypeptidase
LLVAGCTRRAPAAQQPTPPGFDADQAFAYLKAQTDFGPRVPGTQAHRDARAWLMAELGKASDDVQVQPFTRVLRGNDVQMANIVAVIPGIGAAPRERVLLCAHWDSRPTADKDPDPAKRTTPISGANDGASGVAVLLEIARQLKTHPLQQDILIVLFDGEDFGTYPARADRLDNMLMGSEFFAQNLPDPKPTWGILLDMVGDTDLNICREPNSEQFAPAYVDRIFRVAREFGYLRGGGAPGFVDAPFRSPIEDDHMPLNRAGVPTVDLIDFDYPSWHTTGDTIDKCSARSLEIVGRVVLATLQDGKD